MKLNVAELEKILKLFYTLSGIRIVILDENCNEIIAYPREKCRFCRELGAVPHLAGRCRQSDLNAIAKCKETDDIYIYKCHMGLTEAIIKIKDQNKIIGYMMFGQITDIKEKSSLNDFVSDINLKFGVKCDAKGIRCRSKSQINAAAQLMDICTSYIQLKDMIMPDNNRITRIADEYIKNHLSEDIKISDICRCADVGRTKLYEAFKLDFNMGVSEYIRKARLNHARSLLKKGGKTVAEVSEECGFTDYNYFSRSFKKEYNISPYRFIKDLGSKI